MKVAIVTLPPVRIATMRKTGPYGPEIGRFWLETFRPWLREQGLLGEPTYGIGHDDPATTPAQDCRYDAGVEVDADFVAPIGVFVTLLPGGVNAVAGFSGQAWEVPGAWRWLLHEWLPASGHAADFSRPCTEYYPRDWRAEADGSFACELRLPLSARPTSACP
jgi:AraC family transcriptional regulator